jgi:hypothetical protein
VLSAQGFEGHCDSGYSSDGRLSGPVETCGSRLAGKCIRGEDGKRAKNPGRHIDNPKTGKGA